MGCALGEGGGVVKVKVRGFWICRVGGVVLGCAGLLVNPAEFWSNLAELSGKSAEFWSKRAELLSKRAEFHQESAESLYLLATKIMAKD